jgi:hypothetical protein
VIWNPVQNPVTIGTPGMGERQRFIGSGIVSLRSRGIPLLVPNDQGERFPQNNLQSEEKFAESAFST